MPSSKRPTAAPEPAPPSAEAEVLLGRGQGDVDHGRVEHDHQLGDPEDRQDQPAFVVGSGDGSHSARPSLGGRVSRAI
jgi:hypothetical protein